MKFWHSLLKFFIVWLLSMLIWSFCSETDGRGLVLIWFCCSSIVLGYTLLGATVSGLLQWKLKKHWNYADDIIFFIFTWWQYDVILDGSDFVLLIVIHAVVLIAFNIMYYNRNRWDLEL